MCDEEMTGTGAYAPKQSEGYKRHSNPWHPMSDPVDLKLMGKLLEELAECGAAASRCLIQGINGSEPDTGQINKAWLEKEIADVIANIELVKERFNLNISRVRIEGKKQHLINWHRMA